MVMYKIDRWGGGSKNRSLGLKNVYTHFSELIWDLFHFYHSCQCHYRVHVYCQTVKLNLYKNEMYCVNSVHNNLINILNNLSSNTIKYLGAKQLPSSA